MPCFEIQTIEVDISHITDVDSWAQALEDAGLITGGIERTRVIARISIALGRLGLPGQTQQMVNMAKRIYAQKAIARAASRYGWQMRQTGERRIQLARR